MEEGLTLDEALEYVLEYEESLLDEGYTYEEIYGEDVFEEDSVELQPETKLNKKVSQDPDMRDFVGAGDGSGHDMKTESFDLIMEEVMEEIELMDEDLMANMREKRLNKKLDKMELKDARMDRKEGIKQAKDKARDARVNASLDRKADSRQGRAELSAERKAAYNKFAKGADERVFGGGKSRRGINAEKRAGIKDAKQAYRNVKRDQIIKKKAKSISVEEGVSLDEALDFVLECELDLLDEGFTYEEIYGDALYEDAVEYQPETKLNRKVSLDPDMRDFVGAGDGSGHDMKTEDLDDEEIYEEGIISKIREKRLDKKLNRMALKDARMDRKEGIRGAKDSAKDARVDAFLDKRADGREGRTTLAAERRAAYNKFADGRDERLFGGGKVRRGINAEKRADIRAAKDAYRNVKRDQIIRKKARDIAVEEGVSLDEALEYVLECEQDLLDEGFGYEEIYGEDVFEEDNVEYQPETKLNRKVSLDPDMRDFVGAGDGSGHDMKTEAAILAYEEGISLEEAMEWLMEDEEIYDEGLRDNIRATRAAKKEYKAANKAAGKASDEYLAPHYAAHEERRKDLERRKRELKQAEEDSDRELGGHEDKAIDDYFIAKRDNKLAYKAKKKEIWKGKREDVVDDAIAKLGKDGNDNGVFPTRVDLQDEVYDEGGDPDECAPKRQHQRPVGNVDAVSVDGIDTDDELMLGVEAVIREIEESLDLDDFDC